MDVHQRRVIYIYAIWWARVAGKLCHKLSSKQHYHTFRALNGLFVNVPTRHGFTVRAIMILDAVWWTAPGTASALWTLRIAASCINVTVLVASAAIVASLPKVGAKTSALCTLRKISFVLKAYYIKAEWTKEVETVKCR
jgi:hypothetical protein